MYLRKKEKYLELLTLGDEARGAADGAEERKAWPPILPPDLAAAAGSTVVNTPAANAIIPILANSFFLHTPLNIIIMHK